MKKAIAVLMAVVTMMVCCFTSAQAGSIFNFFADAFVTIAHGVETGFRAIGNTCEYLFTSSTAEEAYSGTKESASKVVNSFNDTVEDAKKVVSDVEDTVVGVTKTIGGAMAAGACGLYELGERVVTGESDYSLTEKYYNVMKDGYKQADNGLVKDVAIIAATVTGAGLPGALAVTAADMAKSGTEYAVGYIDDEQMMNKVVDNAIAVVSCGAGAAVGEVGGAVAKNVASTVVSAGSNITKDLLNDNDNRSAFDIVLEDVAKAAGTTAAKYAMGVMGSSGSADSNAADVDDAASTTAVIDFSVSDLDSNAA